jgi:hypothetical protein
MIIDVDLPKPFQPTTREIVGFFGNCGLVGEEENAILLTLAATNKIPCGVESLSGSGKTVLLDIAMLLLPEDEIYKLGLTSNTATMYDYKAVNNAGIIYIEELQKAINSNNPIMVEILKNITEGKSITRKVYDAVSRKNVDFKIKGDLGVLYSLALENKTKKDDELDRRVINFMTDISQKQNRKVVKYIGKSRFCKSRLKIQEEEMSKKLCGHIKSVLALSSKTVENPFAEFIAKQVPVPFVKVRSHINHYYNLIDACTKFYFKDRTSKDEAYFSSMQDIYTVHALYGKTFNRKVHNLPQLGEDIMKIFDGDIKGWKKDKEKAQQTLFQDEEGEDKIYHSTTKIHTFLKDKGILLKHNTVQQQCEDLVEAGFLGKDIIGRKFLYHKTDEVEEFENKFDFTECLKAGYDNMKKHFPDIADEWYQKQLNEDGRLKLFHPIENETYSMEVIE